jgi:2,3-diketo-5-methylthio-1-phosphopentane phosphatase
MIAAEGGLVAVVNGSEESDAGGVDLAALGVDPVPPTLDPLLGSRSLRGDVHQPIDLELAPRESALYRVRRHCSLAVFCDFDGTFVVQDVGKALVRAHAPDLRPALIQRWIRGEITAWEYNLEIFPTLDLPWSEVDAFLRTVELDPGARELVVWCERSAVPFRILSDGFDYNLNRLQILHDLPFRYTANRLDIDSGHWRIQAGCEDPACICGTGVCKRRCIQAFRRQHSDVTIVYIGNGRVSDTCGSLSADVVFAKDSLAEELERRGVAFEPFTTLRDVLPTLERLL